MLLANGAKVDAKDKDGVTPLIYASMAGYKGVVVALLANKANVSAKDNRGRTALDWAQLFQHKDVAVLLSNHGGHH